MVHLRAGKKLTNDDWPEHKQIVLGKDLDGEFMFLDNTECAVELTAREIFEDFWKLVALEDDPVYQEYLRLKAMYEPEVTP